MAITRGDLQLDEVGLFFALNFVGGGIVSFIVQHFLNKLNRKKLNKVVLLVIGLLTAVSTLSMVVNIAISYTSFGSNYMIAVDPVCDS